MSLTESLFDCFQVIALVNLKEIHDQLVPHLIDEKAHEPRALARVYHQEEEPRFEVHTRLRRSIIVHDPDIIAAGFECGIGSTLPEKEGQESVPSGGLCPRECSALPPR